MWGDYFGPLLVRQRRSDTKRYGCLFTCMTTRTVCLELAVDLSTYALLNAIRRFVSRYGETTRFYSDNDTNQVGAERVLRKESNLGTNRRFIIISAKRRFNGPSTPQLRVIWVESGKG